MTPIATKTKPAEEIATRTSNDEVVKLIEPSFTARCTCASALIGFFAIWGKWAYRQDDKIAPGGKETLHSFLVPLGLVVFYLASLPLLRMFTVRFLSNKIDVRLLLRESMILYNASQVLLNGWMVYKILHCLVFRGHPLVGGKADLVDTGVTYAVWIHYVDKYLEFFDTYFMILRGKMDQVTFLHVYHHASISCAWWAALRVYPGGDVYFGALINSWIHVMMYSYYTLSLLKISCPWKKYLTMAQLAQFATVIAYSFLSLTRMPVNVHWTAKLGISIQVFEMLSLFILFMHFYRKAYSKKRSRANNVVDSSINKTIITDKENNESCTNSNTYNDDKIEVDGSSDVANEQSSVSTVSSEDDQ